ncbi:MULTISPECIES: GIY-YIG nuclease family protein [unclassified Arthrobacter]|uniref:GIY-YIG nuclease family protein n=1 Tax=Pseudarthrobacter sp. S6 TaxID=3418420 RepID=UPI003390BAE5
MKLDRTAEKRLTAWMSNHLLFTSVQLADDKHALDFEDRIIQHLLPPLNIEKADGSPYREALTATRSALRSAIAAGPHPRDDQDF